VRRGAIPARRVPGLARAVGRPVLGVDVAVHDADTRGGRDDDPLVVRGDGPGALPPLVVQRVARAARADVAAVDGHPARAEDEHAVRVEAGDVERGDAHVLFVGDVQLAVQDRACIEVSIDSAAHTYWVVVYSSTLSNFHAALFILV
jgi:hypothetical protein